MSYNNSSGYQCIMSPLDWFIPIIKEHYSTLANYIKTVLMLRLLKGLVHYTQYNIRLKNLLIYE